MSGQLLWRLLRFGAGQGRVALIASRLQPHHSPSLGRTRLGICVILCLDHYRYMALEKEVMGNMGAIVGV